MKRPSLFLLVVVSLASPPVYAERQAEPQGDSTPANASDSPGLPPPMLAPGKRWSLGVGVAFPSGDFDEGDIIDTSFLLSGRFGHEYRTGRWGFTPAMRVDLAYWFNDAGVILGESTRFATLHLGGEVRATAHLGEFLPFASLGLGIDANLNDAEAVDSKFGVGMTLRFGLEKVIDQSFLLGGHLAVHPGFTDASEGIDNDVAYVAILLTLGGV